MRWRLYGNRKIDDGIIELCFMNVNLLNKYRRQKRIKGIIQTLLMLLWVTAVVVFNILMPEEVYEQELIPVICGVLSIELIVFASECVWSLRCGKLFDESLRSLPNNEEGNLRRSLIGNFRAYYKIAMPIIGFVFLAVLGGIFLIYNVWDESLLAQILSFSLFLLPILIALLISWRSMRERMEIAIAIEQKHNPYNDSDLYKN